MPIAIAVIALVAIIFGTMMIASIAKAFFGFLSSRNQPAQAPEGLLESELHALISDAVAEATQPLVERIAALEQQATVEQLPPAQTDLLGDAGAVVSEAALDAPQRRLVR